MLICVWIGCYQFISVVDYQYNSSEESDSDSEEEVDTDEVVD